MIQQADGQPGLRLAVHGDNVAATAWAAVRLAVLVEPRDDSPAAVAHPLPQLLRLRRIKHADVDRERAAQQARSESTEAVLVAVHSHHLSVEELAHVSRSALGVLCGHAAALCFELPQHGAGLIKSARRGRGGLRFLCASAEVDRAVELTVRRIESEARAMFLQQVRHQLRVIHVALHKAFCPKGSDKLRAGRMVDSDMLASHASNAFVAAAASAATHDAYGRAAKHRRVQLDEESELMKTVVRGGALASKEVLRRKVDTVAAWRRTSFDSPPKQAVAQTTGSEAMRLTLESSLSLMRVEGILKSGNTLPDVVSSRKLTQEDCGLSESTLKPQGSAALFAREAQVPRLSATLRQIEM